MSFTRSLAQDGYAWVRRDRTELREVAVCHHRLVTPIACSDDTPDVTFVESGRSNK